MANANPYYLGFDYGSQRIGVAVGQQLTATASPLAILKARAGQPDWNQISALLREWQPAALIIGLPLRADGSDSASTEGARRFMRRLHGRFGLPVHGIDETLSSHAAAERSANADAPLDDLAAQVILETWFAQQTKPATAP